MIISQSRQAHLLSRTTKDTELPQQKVMDDVQGTSRDILMFTATTDIKIT
jgi:hypothetical protein